MVSIVLKLAKAGAIHLPHSFLKDNIHYEVVMGSQAYGLADKEQSDTDIVSFCIPPKHYIFPHLSGFIPGFGPKPPSFEQWQKHHICHEGREYDLTIYGIVKFFELCRQNNPNMVDALFVPENCIIHCTQVGRLVRDNRHLFLSKECWKKFRGYAWSQLKKARSCWDNQLYRQLWAFEKEYNIPKNTTFHQAKEASQGTPDETLAHLSLEQAKKYFSLYQEGMNHSKRFESRKIHGCDTKFLYHLVRLFDEVEQILMFGDLDLQRAKDFLKAVRRGDISFEQIQAWAEEKDRQLERLYYESSLPAKPPYEALRDLLLQCLEEHYGNLNQAVTVPSELMDVLEQIEQLVWRARQRL